VYFFAPQYSKDLGEELSSIHLLEHFYDSCCFERRVNATGEKSSSSRGKEEGFMQVFSS